METSQQKNTDFQSEFVYAISKSEIQMFAEHFLDRELTPVELESFEIRFDKHLCTEFVVSAIEDCLSEITDSVG